MQDRPSARDKRIVHVPAGETNTSTRWPLLDNPWAITTSPKLSLSKATKSGRLAHNSTAPAGVVVNVTIKATAARRTYRNMAPSFRKATHDHRRTKDHSCGELVDGRSAFNGYLVLETENIKISDFVGPSIVHCA
ncbi:hypothetical protein AYJ54_06310 [Bradyrhizobium centrolobii]|uniref:Uncharacterized protein n=1 Tax=Bradyrhizobium centrolobii TaxID=1505087 RepID=A0A176Z082_9BRAD|nr:hypothetical protein AYJ54_06310 [Bradyrhizobium centrolobii]